MGGAVRGMGRWKAGSFSGVTQLATSAARLGVALDLDPLHARRCAQKLAPDRPRMFEWHENSGSSPKPDRKASTPLRLSGRLSAPSAETAFFWSYSLTCAGVGGGSGRSLRHLWGC